MPRFMLVFSILLTWVSAAMAAETVCPALRAIELSDTLAYLVVCTEGDVAITQAEFNTNRGKGGNFGQFCATGPTYPPWRVEARWETGSGQPEVCDVFTVKKHAVVQTAAFVYFMHSNGDEPEIDTSVHAPVFDGPTLVGFAPPVPGITVEP